MTELRHFLASLYDAVSEAEMQALLNGRRRLRRMVESGEFSDDVSLPVYHATDLSVTLDVGLEARETKRGIQVFVTEPSADDQTELDLDLEVYDFLQAGDLTDGADDSKRPEASIDVHIPLREPPVDAGDAVDTASVVDEKSDNTRKQARGRHERTEDERTNEERTDDEQGDRKSTTDESTNDERTKHKRSKDERVEEERTKEERDKDERDKDERTKDADAAEKRTERERERLRNPTKFPGLSLPREWTRAREDRDAEEDDR